MNRNTLRLLFGTLILVPLMINPITVRSEEAAAEKKPTYVGSKACKTCHQGEKNGKIHETWLESKHAHALMTLDSAKGERTDAKCLKCHTTGYGKGGYGSPGMEALDLAGVGCESCHGPGSEYKSLKVMKDHDAAVKAGLWTADEKMCVTCHNAESPQFKSFDYKTAYAKIEHHVPVKTDSAATPPK